MKEDDMGHPDDEVLSAHLDGEDTPWASHIGACDRCSGRLDGMTMVRHSLAMPVEVNVEVRERAVAAALATYDAGFSGLELGQPTAEAKMVSIPPIGARRLRRPALVAMISVAAALLTVMGTVGVLTRTGANDGGSRAASTPEAVKDRSSAAAGATSGDSIHLGEIADTATLVAKVTGGGSFSVESSTGQSSSASGGAVAGASASNHGDTGDATSSARSAPSASPPALASPGTIEDSAGGIANSGARSSADALSGSAEGGGVSAAPWACEPEVRNSHPGAGEVVYRATARHLGAEALVFGLQVAPGSPEAPMPLTLVVVARDGCRPLLEAVVP